MIKINKETLNKNISDYYNSVEKLFNYRRKNNWKKETTIVFLIISIFFLFVNLIPILPYADKDYMLPVYKFLQNYFPGIENLPYNFLVKWGLGTIIAILFFLIVLIPAYYWKLRKKKFLPTYLLSFCYSYTLREELKSFILNENDIHLENATEYFNRINTPLQLFWVDDKNNSTTAINLSDLKMALENKSELVELTEESKQNINVLSEIPEKITERLKRNQEIEKVLPLIELLTYYEFAKIKPNEKVDGLKMKEVKKDFLNEFIENLSFLDQLEIVDQTIQKNKINFISRFISNSFSSQNIFVLFISWLLFLVILFVSISTIVINILNEKIDSTILIGLLTAPFLGAITMVGIIYNKNKK